MKFYANPDAQTRKKLCQRPEIKDVEAAVASIFSKVEAGGDKAIDELTLKYDGIKVPKVGIGPYDIASLADQTPDVLKNAIKTAYRNISKFQRVNFRPAGEVVETSSGVKCWQRTVPIERVGLYIPGGTAPLFSTLLMLAIPAQIAGCGQITVCTPPNQNGSIEPAMAYAAQVCGIKKINIIGGIQAIAVMALGTQSVTKVDKIFGPGNRYVTAAKIYAQKFGVTIDMPAGPSELLVIADSTANTRFVAADLLSQAEHGPDSQVILATNSEVLAKDVLKEIRQQIEPLSRGAIALQALKNSFCIVFDSLAKTVEFSNLYSPEHLILMCKNSDELAKKVVNVGSVFLGNYSPESVGDYASGTNHCLPTNAYAKSYSGISADDFVKKISFQKLTKSGLDELSETVTVMARAEGLEAHAIAVEVRLKSSNKLKYNQE